MRLGMSQSRSGRGGEEKIQSHCREANPRTRSYSLVPILTHHRQNPIEIKSISCQKGPIKFVGWLSTSDPPPQKNICESHTTDTQGSVKLFYGGGGYLSSPLKKPVKNTPVSLRTKPTSSRLHNLRTRNATARFVPVWKSLEDAAIILWSQNKHANDTDSNLY
jgi:hypothetical protein